MTNKLACTLCTNILNEAFNLEKHSTSIKKEKLLDFLETAIDEIFLATNYYICRECFNLLNELEKIKIRSKEIIQQLTAYFKRSKTVLKVSGTCKFKQKIKHRVKTEVTRSVNIASSQNQKKSTTESVNDNEIKRDPDEHRNKSKSQNESIITESVETEIRRESDKHINSLEKVTIKKEVRETGLKEESETLENHKCRFCSETFLQLSYLQVHELTHDISWPRCNDCNKNFKSQKALKIHSAAHKRKPLEIFCIHCGKTFTQKVGLIRHLPIHTGEMKHQCDVCGKRFTHESSLKSHTLSHTGVKSYECEICGVRLLSTSHLNRHKRVHSGEKNYSCSKCGRRFAEKYNLHTHEKLHSIEPSTEKRHYRCQICPSVFFKKTELRNHEQVEHSLSNHFQSQKLVRIKTPF